MYVKEIDTVVIFKLWNERDLIVTEFEHVTAVQTSPDPCLAQYYIYSFRPYHSTYLLIRQPNFLVVSMRSFEHDMDQHLSYSSSSPNEERTLLYPFILVYRPVKLPAFR